MANMSIVTNVVEPLMIEWVSSQVGMPLSKRKVPIGKNSAKQTIHFDFDGISVDGAIACLASSSNSNKVGQTRKLFRDAYLLMKIPAKRKIMVFLEDGRDLWSAFYNDNDGILELSLIEPMFCQIDPTIMAELAQSRQNAKDEVGNKGRVKKTGGSRR